MDKPTTLEGCVALRHLGVIRASGPDAQQFLQGQLTNDVVGLEAHRTRLAGFCSAKGRLQASFLVWKASDDEVFLACAQSVLAATLKRLSMFVLRARCKLSDASDDRALVGCVGGAAETVTAGMAPWDRREADGTTMIRLPDAAGVRRAIVVGPDSTERDTVPSLELENWRWLEVQSGIPIIEASTVDQFVPQMINFELLAGVDFQKGCYPGQEVVARSQYRGTIKRRMFLFDCDDEIRPGGEVFHSADPSQPAGMVVNAARGPTGSWSGLVEVKLGALDEGALHANRHDGPPLRRTALPYAVA